MIDANFSPQPMQTAAYIQSPFVPPPAPTSQPAPAPASPPPVAQPAPAPTPTPETAPAAEVPIGSPDAKPVKTTAPDAPAPMPPQRFTPNTTTHRREWGKPPWGVGAIKHYPGIVNSTHMPSPQESPGVIAGAGRQLASWGAPSVQGPASIASAIAQTIGPFLDFYSHNAFSSRYRDVALGGIQADEARMRMRVEQMQLQHETMMDNASQAVINSNLDMAKYDDVLSAYEAGDISEDQARQEIRGLAGNDQTLIGALDNHGLRGVYNLTHSRNSKTKDLWSAIASLDNRATSRGKTAKEESESDKSLSPSEGGGMAGGASLPGGPGDAPVSAAEGTPDDEPASLEETNKKLMKDHDLTQAGVDAARRYSSMSDTQKAAYEKAHPKNGAKVVAASNDLLDREDAIANSRMSPDEKLKKIAALDPSRAADIDALIKYRDDPKSKAETPDLLRVAGRVDPQYHQGNYALLQKMQDTPEMREVMRVAGMGRGALTIMDALKKLPEDEKIPNRQLDAMIAGHWTGDAKYANLYHAIQMFAGETASVISGTGTARMTYLKALTANMSESSSPAQIRGGVVAEMRSGEAFADYLEGQWKTLSNTDRPYPLTQNRDIQNMRSIIRMDTDHGTMPPDSNPEVLNVSKSAPKGAPQPLPQSERAVWQAMIQEHQNDPAWADAVRRAREALGMSR